MKLVNISYIINYILYLYILEGVRRYPLVIKFDFNIKRCVFNKKSESILIYDNHEIRTFKSNGDIINITKLNGNSNFKMV